MTQSTGAHLIPSGGGGGGGPGPAGPAGQGVPPGGTTGQVLAKTSATDYATAWVAATAGATGPAGPPGNPGPTGPAGADGAPGVPPIIYGNVPSAGNLPNPDSVPVGGVYITTDTGHGWQVLEGEGSHQWWDFGPFAGPAGPQGPPGASGGGGTGSDEVWIASSTPADTYKLWLDTTGSRDVYIDKLIATTPFFVGHRGSGDVWPEHTMLAYQGAFDAGASALEISTQVSSDGVWFCLHDVGASGLDRTTTGTGDPSLKTWAQLAVYDVDIANCGPAYPTQSIKLPLLDDVLAKFFGKVTLFIESKDYRAPAVTALIAKLSAIPGATSYIVWKMAASFPSGLAQAKAAGFRTWAYLDAPLNTTQLNGSLGNDYLGVSRDDSMIGGGSTGLTDTEIATVISTAGAKKVIAWAPPRKAIVDKLVAAGVSGAVTPQLPYILGKRLPRDNFASNKVSSGDIAFSATQGYTLDSGTMWMNGSNSGPTVMMGSLTPTSLNHEIYFDMKLDVLPVDLTKYCGIGFGKIDDQSYQPGVTTNQTGGYHAVLGADGRLRLFTHAPGVASGTQLGSTIQTTALTTSTYATVRVKVTPTSIECQRMDDATAAINVANTQYRGLYFHLFRNYSLSIGENARFRNVIVTNQ